MGQRLGQLQKVGAASLGQLEMVGAASRAALNGWGGVQGRFKRLEQRLGQLHMVGAASRAVESLFHVSCFPFSTFIF